MLLLGFVAMHGLTAGSATGAHQHASVNVGATGDRHAEVDHEDVGAITLLGGQTSSAALSPVDSEHDGWMKGCALALSGLVTLVLAVHALGLLASMLRRPGSPLRDDV